MQRGQLCPVSDLERREGLSPAAETLGVVREGVTDLIPYSPDTSPTAAFKCCEGLRPPLKAGQDKK